MIVKSMQWTQLEHTNAPINLLAQIGDDVHT